MSQKKVKIVFVITLSTLY